MSSNEWWLNTPPTQIHKGLVDTLRESAVLYDIMKRWCHEFICGRWSYTDEHADGASTTTTTQEIVKKVHDLVLQDRRVTIISWRHWSLIHVVYNVLTAELDMSKLFARCVWRMLTDAHKQTHYDVETKIQSKELAHRGSPSLKKLIKMQPSAEILKA